MINKYYSTIYVLVLFKDVIIFHHNYIITFYSTYIYNANYQMFTFFSVPTIKHFNNNYDCEYQR